MKLFKNIYLVGGGSFGYSHPNDCNVYLIDGGTELALVDTGGSGGTSAIIENMRRFDLNPELTKMAINTHCHYDHIGGNKRIKELTGCKIAVHDAEAEFVEKLDPRLTLINMALKRGLKFDSTKVDLKLEDGALLRIGRHQIEIVHTPGHTPGCISILMETDGKRILFAGDIVSSQGRLGFINGPGFDLGDWKTSLKKLLELNIDVLLPGHGTFVLSGGSDHIKAYSEKMNLPWRTIATAIDFQFDLKNSE
jgi:glyoxylase-like metal-dependent hydrolase (beta-lactamase superfamily II)